MFQEAEDTYLFEQMPQVFFPTKGVYGLRDYEKIFCIGSKNGEDIFKLREISKETGCLVVVRPDQHIANILPLKAFSEISEFFDKFMTKR